jgi:hypothetical protein
MALYAQIRGRAEGQSETESKAEAAEALLSMVSSMVGPPPDQVEDMILEMGKFDGPIRIKAMGCVLEISTESDPSLREV